MSKARPITSVSENTEYKYALIYCRVSSDRQKIEGHGLESQEHRCREYATGKGYEVVGVFHDSYSGGGDFLQRPALNKMLQFLDQNAHERYVVIFDDLSRFARDVVGHFNLRQLFDTRGVKLECPNFKFEDTPEGLLVENMMAAQHQYYRQNNRRQVMQKQKARLESGYWAFGAIRGYKMLPCSEHGKILTPIEPDASILRFALEGFASGRFQSKVDVCRYMCEKGFWKKQKPERYIDKLSLIINNPIYAGYIEYPVWGVKLRKGQHEGIIGINVFELNKKRLQQGNLGKRVRTDVSEFFPLRGLLVCEFNNKPITGAFSKSRGKKYPYYFCQSPNCECGRRSTPAQQMHQEFDELLKKQTLKTEVRDTVKNIFDVTWQAHMNELEQMEKGTKKNITELEAKLDKLVNSAVNATTDTMRKVYENKAEACAVEVESLKAQLVNDCALSIPYRTALEKVLTLLESPYKLWHSVDVHEKQKLFHFIFLEKIPYSKKAGYRIDNLPSAKSLFEEFVSTNSRDVDIAGKTLNQLKDYFSRFWEYYQSSPNIQKALADT